MPTSRASKQRISRLANDFGWYIYEAEPEAYLKDELQQIWYNFCEEQGAPSGGFGSVLYYLQIWYVLKPTGKRRNRYRVVRPTQSTNWKNPRPGELEGSLEGSRPAAPVNFGRGLPTSPLPPEFILLKQCDVFQMRRGAQSLLVDRGIPTLKLPIAHRDKLALSLSELQQWPEFFRNLLYAEELQMSFDIGMYDMHVTEPLHKTVVIGTSSKMYSLEVPGVAEKRPSVLRGDAVLVISKRGRFKAYVHRVELDKVVMSFHSDFDNHPPFSVKFFFTRTPLKLMHRALEDTRERIPYLYSAEASPLQSSSSARSVSPSTGSYLNAEQQRFVDLVVNARSITKVAMTDEDLNLALLLSHDTSDPRERRLKRHGETTLYHQTDPDSAKKILDIGRMFRGSAGALGGGIYFAKTPKDTERKAHHKGVVLQCLVRLGSTKQMRECDPSITFTKLQREGYDSVRFDGFQSGPEYVVYNFDQVTPVGIVGDKRLRPFSLPLVLWGPPGTGKTTTLVSAIRGVLNLPGAKVLATAPSNAASDLLCEKLSQLGIGRNRMLRLNGMLRNEIEVPAIVKPYTRKGEFGFDTFDIPALEELQTFDIIVSTCTTAGYLASRSNLPGWFTHVFVDEAAQSLEPEILIPVSVLEPGGLLVLGGDFKQLGPIIRSPQAAIFGLDMSLLERLVQRIGIDHSRVHTLLQSYRAHPSILDIYSQTMYGGMLRSVCPSSSYDMTLWPYCSVTADGYHPVVFHNVQGVEARESTSPSWSNPDEVEVLREYIRELVDYSVDAADVGIITPYQLQCKRLKLMCKTEGFNAFVGTTEQFQGRESRVILLSTVRSREENEVPQDLKFALGFVGNEKRSNVALSRARSALVVVGNLRLLSADSHWNKVIKIAMRKGYCRGSNFSLQQPWVIDGREQRGASGVDQELVSRPWQRFE